jgi:putative addiction module antidote
MQTKVRKIGNGYGVLLPKELIEQLRLTAGSVLTLTTTGSEIHMSPYDAEFSDQVEAFRRTEPRHRNSYKELAK